MRQTAKLLSIMNQINQAKKDAKIKKEDPT
jgi:hypothetical protein